MAARPTAAELLEAVRELLEDDLLADTGDRPDDRGRGGGAGDRLDDRTRFQVRVAAHALAIVERELTLGPAVAATEHERLRALLGEDAPLEELERSLARRIRDGSLDDQRDAVVEHIRETLRATLSIAKPGYADGP